MKNPEKVTLSLQMSVEERQLIKSDAKALGMTPSRYVSMICRAVNETAREDAMIEFCNSLTSTVLEKAAKTA